MEDENNIVVMFPYEPVEVSLVVIPKIIQWLAEPPHGMEAVHNICKCEHGSFFNMIRLVKPEGWGDDKIRTFVAMVGHQAALMAKQAMDN